MESHTSLLDRNRFKNAVLNRNHDMPPKKRISYSSPQTAVSRLRKIRDDRLTMFTEMSGYFMAEGTCVSNEEMDLMKKALADYEMAFYADQRKIMDLLTIFDLPSEFSLRDRPVTKIFMDSVTKLQRFMGNLLPDKFDLSLTSENNGSVPSDQHQIRFIYPNTHFVLGIANVMGRHYHGQAQPVRVLFDNFSEISSITWSCVRRLRPVKFQMGPIFKLFNTTNFSCEISHNDGRQNVWVSDCFSIIEEIKLPILLQRMPNNAHEGYKHLQLADPPGGRPQSIEMIIGRNLLTKLLGPMTSVITKPGFPPAIHTSFGWVIIPEMDQPHQFVSMS